MDDLARDALKYIMGALFGGAGSALGAVIYFGGRIIRAETKIETLERDVRDMRGAIDRLTGAIGDLAEEMRKGFARLAQDKEDRIG